MKEIPDYNWLHFPKQRGCGAEDEGLPSSLIITMIVAFELLHIFPYRFISVQILRKKIKEKKYKKSQVKLSSSQKRFAFLI